MNDYIAAVILGIVEGLTEFLPISSTAHIRIVQQWLGQDPTDEYWKMFAVVIQLGAILSVMVYFAQRLWKFVRTFPSGEGGNGVWWRHPLSLVVISFFVTAVPCFLIDKLIEKTLENTLVIAIALIVGGIVMWWIDRRFSVAPKTQRLEEMNLKQAITIGFAQIFAAAFPGTSRSMSTIAGGQVMGLTRAAALEFSFFLSIPVMIAATGYKLLKYVTSDRPAMSSEQWITLGIGFGVSFIVALAVIAWFMHWVRQRGFTPFAIYRVIFGAIILVCVLTGVMQ